MELLDPAIIRKHKGISFVGVTASFICHDGNGKVFLAKRSNKARDEHGHWDGGGGGLKHGETLEETVIREVKEEYNASVLKLDYVGHLEVFRTNESRQRTHWVAFFHAVKVDPSQVRIMEPDIFEESGWFTLNNLPTPLHTVWQGPLLETYGDKIRSLINR